MRKRKIERGGGEERGHRESKRDGKERKEGRERDEETKNQRAGRRESRATRGERAREVRKREEGAARRRKGGYGRVVSSLQCIAFTNPPSPVTPRALPSPLPPISLPRQIAHDVPLMKRSTKPASLPSDSGRRDSSRGRGKGARGRVQGSHTHTSRVSTTGCRCTPFVFVPTVAKSYSSREGRKEDDVPISFLPSSVSLAKTLTAGCRFEGYGVIGLVERREERERHCYGIIAP